jgi:transcriptional regulator with XRE-family HTH domain
MSEGQAPEVGQRIRALREQRALSLRALAERCGLSSNAISLIERGENSPTVSSLHLLAMALGVSITDFFEAGRDQSVVFVPPTARLRSQAGGIVLESLGIGLRNQQLEPFLMELEPGAGTAGEPVSHRGEEFVYCLEGRLAYQVGEQTFDLEPGSALLFQANQPHSFQNVAREPAKLLMLFMAGEDSPLARRLHLEAPTAAQRERGKAEV